MKVLTVYAHPDPQSFCHGVLEHFTAGLKRAGHTSQVVDLHAIGFDPVFRARDSPSYISSSIPSDILAQMAPRQRVLASARGPLRRWLAARALRGKSDAEVAGLIRKHMPRDVLAQQAKVAWAEGLAFIAPIHFCNFPAILKGWIDRVFTYDFAYRLTSAGWRGDVDGRIPLLKHRRALIMTSTLFDTHAYDDGLRAAISRVMDDWSFRYPGIEDVAHVYFHAVTCAPPERIRQYLERAFELGRTFERPAPARASPPPAAARPSASARPVGLRSGREPRT